MCCLEAGDANLSVKPQVPHVHAAVDQGFAARVQPAAPLRARLEQYVHRVIANATIAHPIWQTHRSTKADIKAQTVVLDRSYVDFTRL